MKNVLFLSMLAVGMALASCSNDEIATGGNSPQTMTIKVDLPDGFAAKSTSRADVTTTDYVNSAKGGLTNNPGASVNFYVALFYGSNPTPVYSEVKTSAAAEKSATFTPTVVMGEKYRLVSWAEITDGTTMPDVTKFDFTKINIVNGLNDEAKDAYFVSQEIDAAATINATLKRPYGKLRLVAQDYGTMNTQTGKTVKTVKVTYKTPFSTVFNAVDGTFGTDATTNEYSAGLKTYSGDGTDVQTLFTAYIPVEADGSTAYPFDVEVTYNDNSTYSRSFSNDIPIQRNYLTTLKGNFFTTTSTMTLTIDEEFDLELENPIVAETSAELVAAVDAGLDVVLKNDMELSQTITPNSRVDLDGHTLTIKDNYQILLENGKECTIIDGKIEQKRTSSMPAIWVKSGSTLTLDNMDVKIDGYACAVFIQGDAAKANIVDSKIYGQVYGVSTNATYSFTCDVNIKDSEISAGACGIMMNVPLNFTIENTSVTGVEQGIFVRGAKAKIKDCTITLNPAKADYASKYINSDWKTGNEAPFAAMTIGNRYAESYQYPTVVDIVNTKLIVNDEYKDLFPALYGYANTTEGNGTTLTYDSDCTFTGRTTKSVDAETVYDGKSIILGTKNNITVNGNAIQ